MPTAVQTRPAVQRRAFSSTAYGPPWGGINGMGVTAAGVDLRDGKQVYGVAVDPNVIPLGSQLAIWPNPFGYRGTFVAFDTGGAIKGNRIDFYDWRGRSHQLRWGRRSVGVTVAARGSGTVNASLLDELPFPGIPKLPGMPGLGDLDEGPGGLVPDVGDLVSWPKDAIALFRKMLTLFYPSTWWRVGKVLLGVFAGLFAIHILLKALLNVNVVRGGVRLGGAVATRGASEAIGAASR